MFGSWKILSTAVRSLSPRGKFNQRLAHGSRQCGPPKADPNAAAARKAESVPAGPCADPAEGIASGTESLGAESHRRSKFSDLLGGLAEDPFDLVFKALLENTARIF